MADYSMDDPKWSKNESRVLLYLENNDIGDMEAVIRWNLDQGRDDVANRKKFWNNITNLFSMLPNSPISRGRESDLPEEVSQTITQIAVQYSEAASAFFATDPLYGEIVRKHGKSGGGTYADSDEYAESLMKSMKSRLTTYYRNSLKVASGEKSSNDTIYWDGEMNGHIPVIHAPVESSAEVEEEE